MSRASVLVGSPIYPTPRTLYILFYLKLFLSPLDVTAIIIAVGR